MSEPSPVLDSSAILAVLQNEPGAELVMEALEGEESPVISAVNMCEVASRLAEHGMDEETVREVLGGLRVSVISFDSEWAIRAGLLRPGTKSAGLSLADRACLALGLREGRQVLTADRAWARLPDDFDVKLIRHVEAREHR